MVSYAILIHVSMPCKITDLQLNSAQAEIIEHNQLRCNMMTEPQQPAEG